MIPIYLYDDEKAVRYQFKIALEWKIFIKSYDIQVVCAATAQMFLCAVQDSPISWRWI